MYSNIALRKLQEQLAIRKQEMHLEAALESIREDLEVAAFQNDLFCMLKIQ